LPGTSLAFDQHRIAELVSAIAALEKRCANAVQHRVIGEGSKELKMALAALMHAGQNRIDDREARSSFDATARDTVARPYAAVCTGGGLEGADDSRADGNNPRLPVIRSTSIPALLS
jgi:hypothetical protein